MNSLNWVDVVLAVVIAGNCALGLKRGLLREAFNLLGIGLGLFAGFRCYEALGWNIEGWLEAKPAVANLVAFLVIFLGIAFVTSYVGHLLRKGAKKLFLGWLDWLGGGVFGFARGLIFASVLAFVFALFPVFPRLEKDLQTSLLGPHVIKVAPALYGTVMEKVRGKGYEGLDVKKLVDDYIGGDEAKGNPPAGEGPPGEAAPGGDKGPSPEKKPPAGKTDDFTGSD